MDDGKPKMNNGKALAALLLVIPASALVYYQGGKQPSSAPEVSYPDQTIYADRSNLEPGFLRGMLATEYLEVMKELNPNYNYMDTQLRKRKAGFTLYAVHSFFNRFEFDYGRSAKVVSKWIDDHRAELKHAQIVGVGVKGTGPYADYVAYTVK